MAQEPSIRCSGVSLICAKAFSPFVRQSTSLADSVSGLPSPGRGDRPLEGAGGQVSGKVERARDDEAASGVGEQTHSPRLRRSY